MENWLPGYERDPEPGAGISIQPGNRKVVIHTTETGPGSWQDIRNRWRGSSNWGRGLPHFLAEDGRYVQLLPFNVGAYTSVNGGIDANRAGGPIQIEIVHYAQNPFSNLEYETLGRWIADLIRNGISLDLDHCPRFYGPNDGFVLATKDSPVRRLIGDYASFNGICGHQHLAGNDHWDPGKIDIDRVCAIAKQHLNPHPTPKEDTMVVIYRSKPGSRKVAEWGLDNGYSNAFRVEGPFARHLGRWPGPGYEGWDRPIQAVRNNIALVVGWEQEEKMHPLVDDEQLDALTLLPSKL